MKYIINLCEKHYGAVVVDAQSINQANDMVQSAIDAGSVCWTDTEIASVCIKPEIKHPQPYVPSKS